MYRIPLPGQSQHSSSQPPVRPSHRLSFRMNVVLLPVHPPALSPSHPVCPPRPTPTPPPSSPVDALLRADDATLLVVGGDEWVERPLEEVLAERARHVRQRIHCGKRHAPVTTSDQRLNHQLYPTDFPILLHRYRSINAPNGTFLTLFLHTGTNPSIEFAI